MWPYARPVPGKLRQWAGSSLCSASRKRFRGRRSGLRLWLGFRLVGCGSGSGGGAEGGDGVVVGRWKHHVEPVRGAGARSEEREPVYMVPVQMRQQNGAPERCVAQELTHPAQAGPGVDDERRGLAVAGDGDTRGVAAVAQEPGSRRRRRATDAAEGQPHRRPGRSAMTPQNARTGNGRRQTPANAGRPSLFSVSTGAQGSG